MHIAFSWNADSRLLRVYVRLLRVSKATLLTTFYMQLKTDRTENRYGPPKRVRKPPADRHAEK